MFTLAALLFILGSTLICLDVDPHGHESGTHHAD
jgi:hypothetical protein